MASIVSYQHRCSGTARPERSIWNESLIAPLPGAAGLERGAFMVQQFNKADAEQNNEQVNGRAEGLEASGKIPTKPLQSGLSIALLKPRMEAHFPDVRRKNRWRNQNQSQKS